MKNKNDWFHKNLHFYAALDFAFAGVCMILWGAK